MADNNNLVVYCEFDEGRIADVSLELLTKGRKLADRLGIRLEALVVGSNLAVSNRKSSPTAPTWFTPWTTLVSIPIPPTPTQPC